MHVEDSKMRRIEEPIVDLALQRPTDRVVRQRSLVPNRVRRQICHDGTADLLRNFVSPIFDVDRRCVPRNGRFAHLKQLLAMRAIPSSIREPRPRHDDPRDQRRPGKSPWVRRRRTKRGSKIGHGQKREQQPE